MDKKMLKLRRKMKKRKPVFRRQEYFKHARLSKVWRKAKGRHSKLRRGERGRGRRPSPGYGSPKAARGLARSGLRPVLVANVSEISRLDPKTQSAIIKSAVGKKKRTDMQRLAKEKGIRLEQGHL